MAHKDVVFHAVGHELRLLRRAVEEDEVDHIDCHLFDATYGLEAYTGFTVWDGTWCLISLLASKRIHTAGRRVLELGAGIGAVGLVAGAAGGRVILTDLPPVVVDMLEPNIRRNTVSEGCIGTGTVLAHPLDWNEPVWCQQPALPENNLFACDIILAADTVWLKSLVAPFASCVAELLHAPREAGLPHRECYLAFQERATPDSVTFAHPSELLDALADLHCSTVAIEVPLMDDFLSLMKTPEKPMYCFLVTPSCP